jgi:segregation and condensation protein B
MEIRDLEGMIEGILFASGEPVGVERIAAVCAADVQTVLAAAAHLDEQYQARRSGIRLVRLENALQLCSAPEYADIIRAALEARKPPQLSQSALEVLAVVAYYQPVTKSYVEQVRGVDCSYTIGMLSDRGLIEQKGRLPVPGRPALYVTTKAFLRTFSLSSLEELPPLPEARDADPEQLKLENAIAALRTAQPEDDGVQDGGEEA